MSALFEVVGEAAQAGETATAIFVDELQYVEEDELAALIAALHRCAQRKLPILLVGAGLPQLRGKMGKAKSYAERLFQFPDVGPLPKDVAALAITQPAADQGVEYDPLAVDRIFKETKGYPYFLQEWGKHAWDVADNRPSHSKT